MDEISQESRLENTHTGNSTGLLLIVRMETLFLDLKQVINYLVIQLLSKQRVTKNMTRTKAIDEMSRAIENRGAQAGLFIMNESRAKKTFPKMQRFGNIVLFQWDIEQDAAIEKLNAAVIATQLLAEKASIKDQGDRAKVADG